MQICNYSLFIVSPRLPTRMILLSVFPPLKGNFPCSKVSNFSFIYREDKACFSASFPHTHTQCCRGLSSSAGFPPQHTCEINIATVLCMNIAPSSSCSVRVRSLAILAAPGSSPTVHYMFLGYFFEFFRYFRLFVAYLAPVLTSDAIFVRFWRARVWSLCTLVCM